MIQKTDDAPGDVCAHVRSVTIQAVSKLTLEEFMKNFNIILSQAVLGIDDPFYEERGCVIHRVELESYHCNDPNTEAVLQDIIKERTDRLNQKQKQESVNEVRLTKVKGDIEEEKLHGELLQIRHSHHRAEAAMEGEAEADQLRSFLQGLPNIPDDIKYSFWTTLRRLDSVKSISRSKTSLYYTPNDVELSIGTWEVPQQGINQNQTNQNQTNQNQTNQNQTNQTNQNQTNQNQTNQNQTQPVQQDLYKRDLEKRYDFSKYTNDI